LLDFILSPNISGALLTTRARNLFKLTPIKRNAKGKNIKRSHRNLENGEQISLREGET
jgi:hypothetical protein